MQENPIRPVDVKAIDKGIYSCREAQLAIERAKAAGIPVDESELRCADLLEQLTKIRTVYGAGK
jgi:hypothetical protein